MNPLLVVFLPCPIALTSLRNQLTLKSHEFKISPQDERLVLVKQWVEQSPGAQDLFAIWDKANSVRCDSSMISHAILIQH